MQEMKPDTALTQLSAGTSISFLLHKAVHLLLFFFYFSHTDFCSVQFIFKMDFKVTHWLNVSRGNNKWAQI